MPAHEEIQIFMDAPTSLMIDGRWSSATSGATFSVIDPSTETEIAQVADATKADAFRALTAASEVFASFAATSASYRGKLLRKSRDLLIERIDRFVEILCHETGKTLDEARAEVQYAADFLSWFSEEAVRIDGRYSTDGHDHGRKIVTKHPVGPCLLITPWNFPLGMATRKIGPALAAGCTVIIKPPELAPLSTLLFAQLLQDAGLPNGVLNVITTTDPQEVIEPLLSDRRLAKLSFTGSTSVGTHLMASCAPQVVRTSMELGGNAPFIVFEDADLDKAVAGAVAAKFRNGGQACTAANRFLIHETLAAEFIEKLSIAASSMKLGRWDETGTTLGPLIDSRAVAKVEHLVNDALHHGAELHTGGKRTNRSGYFYPATVLSNPDRNAAILNEEIFGPVAVIETFATESEAIQRANDTEYGLVSYVFTQNLQRAQRMIEHLHTGMMGLNVGVVSNPSAPFGGWKRSGIGREGGAEGIGEYLETKYTLTASPYL